MHWNTYSLLWKLSFRQHCDINNIKLPHFQPLNTSLHLHSPPNPPSTWTFDRNPFFWSRLGKNWTQKQSFDSVWITHIYHRRWGGLHQSHRQTATLVIKVPPVLSQNHNGNQPLQNTPDNWGILKGQLEPMQAVFVTLSKPPVKSSPLLCLFSRDKVKGAQNHEEDGATGLPRTILFPCRQNPQMSHLNNCSPLRLSLKYLR